jgi:perosamine synthetase
VAMRFLRSLISGAGDTLLGRRRYCFYFQTVGAADAVRALGFAAASALHLPVARGNRAHFVREAAALLGEGEVFLYGSARAALSDHLVALQLPTDGEVIVTGYTCDVVANAVLQAGLLPVYADIDPATYCMDPRSTAQAISARTRVLIIQHTYGIPAALDELLELARRHDLYVIEDSAAALGSTYRGRQLGTFADAAIFSFELSKTITCGRGGLLLVRAEGEARERQSTRYADVPEPSPGATARELLQLGLSALLYRPRIYAIGASIAAALFRLRLFKPSTSADEERAERPARYVVRLSEPQAALLRRQWRLLPRIADHARELARRYAASDPASALFSQGDPASAAGGDGVCLIRYPARAASPEQRERMQRSFDSLGVELGAWFSAPLSSPAIHHDRFEYRDGTCPVAEAVAPQVYNLPTHLRIRGGVVDAIIDAARWTGGQSEDSA